jgi:hypothetical protein
MSVNMIELNKNVELETTNELNVNIYRFKFTEEFMLKLYEFSKIHQYDDRKVFKDAWKDWVENNQDDINNEIDRLNTMGYEGDIMDKMFKSARYYFRKKSIVKQEPKQRSIYVSINKQLLQAMDNHISRNIIQEEYKPQNGFIDFCNKNITILKESVTELRSQGIEDSEQIENKIKKTYKNRYFNYITSNNNQ